MAQKILTPTQDTYAGSFYAQSGQGHRTFCEIGGWGDDYYSWLQFDISSVPTSKTIISAVLAVYVYFKEATSPAPQIKLITQSWDEDTLTWSNQPSSTTDYMAEPEWNTETGWQYIDITDIFNAWYTGEYPNCGVGFYPTNTNHTQNYFYSIDYTDDTSLREKLTVTYLHPLVAPLHTKAVYIE